MSPRQSSELAGNITRFQHLLDAMSTEDRQWAIRNTEAAITLFVDTVKNRAEVEVRKLLKYLRTVPLPAITKFVAAEKFRVGKTADGIRVAWLGDNFKTNFLKKVEESVPALDLREHELTERAKDPAIITELGGEAQVETTLAHFWEFLKTADQGLWHVRHIRDVNNVLWAVRGRWDGDGLFVEAYPLGDPSFWLVGYRFASR